MLTSPALQAGGDTDALSYAACRLVRCLRAVVVFPHVGVHDLQRASFRLALRSGFLKSMSGIPYLCHRRRRCYRALSL